MKSESMKRLERDAERGDAVAQFNLGVVYDNRDDDNGYIGEDKRSEAIRWLLRAAKQGLPRAQIRLAQVYGEGPGAEKDALKACTWFLLAAAGELGARREAAQTGYERAARHLTVLDVARAHRRVLRWRPKIEPVPVATGPDLVPERAPL